MFKMIAVTALSLSMVLAVGGCGRDSGTSSRSNVAVVNMEAVFRAKGWDQELNKRLTADTADLTKNLEEITKMLQKAISDHRKTIADKLPNEDDKKALMAATNIEELNKITSLTQEQKNEIMVAAANAQQNLENQKQQHQNVFNSRRNTLLQAYVQTITPIAVSVAEGRGFTLMINTGGQVIWAHSAVDITSDVSRAVLEAPISVPELPAATQAAPGR